MINTITLTTAMTIAANKSQGNGGLTVNVAMTEMPEAVSVAVTLYEPGDVPGETSTG